MADLTRLLDLADPPEIRYNRAVVHQAAGRFRTAAADHRAGLEVTDDPDAAARLDDCLRAGAASATGQGRRR